MAALGFAVGSWRRWRHRLNELQLPCVPIFWSRSRSRQSTVYVGVFLASQFASLVLLSILLGALPGILLTMFPGTALIHLIARRASHAQVPDPRPRR